MDPTDTPPITLAFRMRLRPGMQAEYRRRHDAIWPEMLAALRAEGILHYEIFLCPDSGEVFAFQFRTTPAATAPEAADPVIRRWRVHMADVLEMDGDMPLRLPLERVFAMTGAKDDGAARKGAGHGR